MTDKPKTFEGLVMCGCDEYPECTHVLYWIEGWKSADADIAEKDRRIAELEADKSGAYQERDKLVCALSKMFPSTLERHPAEDLNWDEDWRWIVFVSLPAGQATWHIHDSELPMFAHLKRETGARWDGHSTPEKYKRLAQIQNSGEQVAALESRIAAGMAEREVCSEILRIMDTYHEQYPNIDTPGGFEHMGDVWSRFLIWERQLRAALKGES